MGIDDTRYASRLNQSKKIQSIIEDFLGGEILGYSLLDVGCSNGGISKSLALKVKKAFGIDIDHCMVREAVINNPISNISFAIADGGKAPFSDNMFDIIICAQVYEHTNDQTALVEEIWRLLRRGGICFFSGPNRYNLIEEHYMLPFLSWFPKPIANQYLRLFKRGNIYDINPLGYRQLMKLLSQFEIHDYSLEIIRKPELFHIKIKNPLLSTIKYLPGWVLQFLRYFLPNYNIILVKK